MPLSIAASKGALWLRAILPAKYPYQAPIFQIIKAKVVHTHLDDQMRVNHPALVDWNPKSSLLHAIKEVHKVFNDSPPKLAKKEQKAQEE